MDKIEKELSRLSAKERARVREILEKLLRKDMRGVEVKNSKPERYLPRPKGEYQDHL